MGGESYKIMDSKIIFLAGSNFHIEKTKEAKKDFGFMRSELRFLCLLHVKLFILLIRSKIGSLSA